MNNSDDLTKVLNSLDSRIKKIEEFLALDIDKRESETIPLVSEKNDKNSNSLELQVGKFWLARMGVLVFTVGLIFLISSSFNNMPTFLPSLLGLTFATIFFLSHIYGKKWLFFIDNYILSSAFILLFFSMLRLAYFSKDVFIENSLIEISALLVVCIALVVYSFRIKSASLTSLSILFAFITTLLINNSFVALFIVIMITFIVALAARKFNWQMFMIFGIVLSYAVHFIWFFGNPFLAGVTETTLSPTVSTIFILSVFIIYSAGVITNEIGKNEDLFKITSIFINSLLASSSFLIFTYVNSKDDLSLLSFIVFSVFLLVAILSWKYERSKYATFFYSIIGYMLLSIAIISGFQKPEYFILLSWQSLLVVSTAIWFRSRIIIVANFIIYILILISFLFLSSEVTYISISFGIVALFSARILNWKKKELKLNSEGMRNSYLICAFFIFPYSLYNSVPEGFVTISWIAVAILYYTLSVLLNNTKYRWLALSTLMLSVGYAVLFGISELSSELRILTFIILGIVLLGISVLYSKRKSETDDSARDGSETDAISK
jgi:hypothetical protein